MWFMSSPQVPLTGEARRRLVEEATNHVARHGIGERSLRALAAAIGTSHRMLNYHFGSREGLLVEVCRETERRQREALADLVASPDVALDELPRRFFERLLQPELAPLERLFFEIYAQGLQGRPWAVGFLDGVVGSWVTPFVPVLVAAGWSEAEAEADLRLGVAVTRGLLLDALATGDLAAVRAAFERHLAGLQALRPPPGGGAGAPGRAYAVTRRRGPAWDGERPMRRQRGWAAHARFMDALAEEGFIVLGGPLGSGDQCFHFLVTAASEDEIRTRMAQDPWEVSRRLVTESVESWQLLLGAAPPSDRPSTR
jgi:AcrR family transcriptional regulator